MNNAHRNWVVTPERQRLYEAMRDYGEQSGSVEADALWRAASDYLLTEPVAVVRGERDAPRLCVCGDREDEHFTRPRMATLRSLNDLPDFDTQMCARCWERNDAPFIHDFGPRAEKPTPDTSLEAVRGENASLVEVLLTDEQATRLASIRAHHELPPCDDSLTDDVCFLLSLVNGLVE